MHDPLLARYTSTFCFGNAARSRFYLATACQNGPTTAKSFDELANARFNTVDPLFGDYPGQSPWSHCAANPINAIDPTGCKIVGMNKGDVQYFYDQIDKVLSDKKFDDFKSAIQIKGNKMEFKKGSDISKIIEGINKSEDEKNFLNLLSEAIGDNKTLKLEYYFSGNKLSAEGQSILMNAMESDKEMYDYYSRYGGISGEAVVAMWHGGVTTKHGKGAYIFLSGDSEDVTINTFHEVLGHGLSFFHNIELDLNDSNGVRAENLTRRLLRLPSFNGSSHHGKITSPYSYLVFK